MEKVFEYDEIIHEIPEKGGAYVIFPWTLRKFSAGAESKSMQSLTGFLMTEALSIWE